MSRAIGVVLLGVLELAGLVAIPQEIGSPGAVLAMLVGASVIGVLIGGISTGRVKKLQASLATAINEIDIERRRNDRLESEGKIRDVKIEALEKENGLLRSIQMGEVVPPALRSEITGASNRAVEDMRKAITEGLTQLKQELRTDVP